MDDRELDAWLAEHLFAKPETPLDEFFAGTLLARPSFSSTGDGMLLVLEAMRERGWWAELTMRTSEYKYRCQLYHWPSPSPEPVYSTSLPRAVAEAAKAALEA